MDNYSIQFHEIAGTTSMTEKTFGDFAALFDYIKANKTAEWARSVNVHLPARSSDADRRKIMELGFQPN